MRLLKWDGTARLGKTCTVYIDGSVVSRRIDGLATDRVLGPATYKIIVSFVGEDGRWDRHRASLSMVVMASMRNRLGGMG